MLKKLNAITNILDDKLAMDIVYIDFEGKGALCDYFIICSAKNDRHSDSLITYLKEGLQKDYDIYHIDDEDPNWRIIDMGDIIIHIFLDECRNKYQLEKLWSDQKITSL